MQYGKFAEVYDLLMKDAGYDEWAEYAAGFIPRGSSVLECACGTGEISLRLARMGYSVTASDISEDMLRVAAEKQRERGVPANRLRFVRMDMRRLCLNKKADCVIACCDGVNYLTSREAVKDFFSSAHEALKPGGLLLFDVSSRYKLSKVLGGNCFAENGKDLSYLWRNVYDDETKLLEMELSFFVRKGALYERFDETHIQRAHSVRELSAWLSETGFDHSVFGFGTREEPKPEDERIQFTARKK